MRHLSWLIFAALAGPAAAQQTFLAEDFESGLVPPAGWTELNNGNSAGWEPNGGLLYGVTEAYHDDYTGYNDNSLMSPQMDLSGASGVWAHARQYVYYASWRDHHYVDVSVDNGVTFVNVLDDYAGDGESGLTADLSAYAGINGVNVAYHYTGDFASEWSIDQIAVTDSSTAPPPPPPAIIVTLTNPANGHTYHLLEKSDWSTAESAAIGLGGPLTTVDDQAETDWIQQNLGLYNGVQRALWIGLNDEAVEGTYVWADGSSSSYTNWSAGEPSNSLVNDPVNGEDYVHMYGAGGLGGEWNDMHSTTSANWGSDFHGVVEISGPLGPQLVVTNLIAGQVAFFDGQNFTPNGPAVIGYSLTGGGPTTTPYGVAELSPPILRLPPLVADPAGTIHFAAPVPPAAGGRPVWFQAYDALGAALSNGVAAVIG
jgi:hypothetical protein